MPFNVSKSSSWTDKEILKFPEGLNATKSIVLDATDFDVQGDGTSYLVPVGTILKLSATNTDKYVASNGTGTIAGILAHNVDLAARATNANEPAPMYFHECVFATTAIVNFTNYASALVRDLPTCKFD